LAKEGKIKSFKTISAVQLWRKMLGMVFETGHPWITWKDPSNVRSPQDHVGVVHSSNLCTEILLNTSKDETAVCNLGSVNLAAHVTDKGIDKKKLQETVFTAVRMLDNVIDINYYPTVESKAANQTHRPVGLGIMGFQDALYSLNLSYASQEAVDFADESMEAVSYYALQASMEIARERGTYSTFKGSKWDRGFLPIDTIALLEKERGGYLDMDRSSRMDWSTLRADIKKTGLRNSLVMAIAPTATIGNITGVTQSIEPMYKNVFVKSNLSGEFTVINECLVEDLKKLSIWDQEMIDDLKYFDGSVQEITRVPSVLKAKYATAFEIDYEWIIEAASRRQKWIDMGQSLNLYQAKPSGKKISDMYMYAWEKGLKTTYYLRSMGATRIEKSTLDINKYANVVGQRQRDEKGKVMDAPASKPGAEPVQDCESCQ
jgi:ribonucleoside-diphosphate reductase alpha chain